MYTERRLDAVTNPHGYRLFSLDECSVEGQFGQPHPRLRIPQPVSQFALRCFPLPDHLGKIDARRTSRIVTPHSLKAKLTWLKY